MSADRNHATADEAGYMAVPEVLLTVSHEVRTLSDTAAELQNLIGNLLMVGAVTGSSSLYELQSLDRLCQSLEALSDFVGELSQQANADWKIDVSKASRSVMLAELCNRLGGRSGSATEDGTGDFDCFESWPLTG